MASMNGDPFVELEYLKWRKQMALIPGERFRAWKRRMAIKNVSHLRVITENVPGDTLWIQRADGSDLRTTNEEIFSAFADVGQTPEMLEKRIPKVGWEYLGVYMGVELGLDPRGQFALGPCPDQPKVIEVDVDTSCQHGFVVRDVHGPDRFLCRECDERFLSYPEKDKFKPGVAQMPDPQDYSLGRSYTVQPLNNAGVIWAKGVVMPPGKVHTLPLSDKLTQSIQFVGDNHE